MKNNAYKLIAAILCAALIFALPGCGKTQAQAHKQLFAMDTIMTLTAYGDKADAGVQAATDVITGLEKELDPEIEGSAVNAMDKAGGSGVTVPAAITDMLAAAKTVYERSGGALDLTVYPLSKLWGFIDLDSGGEGYVPTAAEIDAQLQKLCFDKITVAGDTVTIPAGGEISFGSVAKGYTSDTVIAAMRAAGVDSAVISLGGNVQTLGVKADGSKWSVGVEDPNSPGANAAILSVGETAVITSGSYQRYFEKDGKTFHHIIDPHTGSPAQSGLKSVTIVDKSGVEADCLSTALFVLGEKAALDYWRTYGGFEMIMISEDGRMICTSGLKDSVTLENSSYTLSWAE